MTKKPKTELRAIAERLGPNATEEQLDAAMKSNPQAIRELMNMRLECEIETANALLRQRLDDDPLLALTIIRTIGWL
jgi:hypothetical protein